MPRQRWKMTMDRHSCDITTRVHCRSRKPWPELKKDPYEVLSRGFVAKSNYYPTLENSEAPCELNAFLFFLFGGIRVTGATETVGQRVSIGCCCFSRVCPLGDSLVAARLKLGRENMASSWAAWEDVHVLFFRFTSSVDIFLLRLALSARFYYNLRLFTSKYLIKDKRDIHLIDGRVAFDSS